MIGDRLKKIRLANNIKQTEISKYLNIEQSAYSKYEQNTRTPNIETLIKIADYYKITLDNLVGRVNEDKTELEKVINKLNQDEKKKILEIIKIIYITK